MNYWYFEIRRRATRAMILSNWIQETKFLGRRWQRRRVYTDLPSQGWVPIERGGKRKEKKLLKIYVIFVDLTEDYCPGIYLDHNNMEPPQWPGTCYNLVKQRSHDSTNNLLINILSSQTQTASNFSDFLPDVWETWRCLVRLAFSARNTGGGWQVKTYKSKWYT